MEPMRTWLFAPGNHPRKVEKVFTVGADAVVLDLEDAVALEQKTATRATVIEALKARPTSASRGYIRVNAIDTDFCYGDLQEVIGPWMDGILLPKVESADTVRQVANIMEAEGAHAGMTIWCMMETPLAMLNAKEIAGAHPRLGGFVMGTSDLAKDLNCAHTPDRLPMVTSLGLCLLAARAYGLAILDGVHLDLSDDAGFEASCKQGCEFGFDGKTLIHPKTIAAANAAFAPAEAEIDWARKIIAAHEEASAEGKGVVVVDGKLIENLHVVSAKKLVAMADLIAEMDGA